MIAKTRLKFLATTIYQETCLQAYKGDELIISVNFLNNKRIWTKTNTHIRCQIQTHLNSSSNLSPNFERIQLKLNKKMVIKLKLNKSTPKVYRKYQSKNHALILLKRGYITTFENQKLVQKSKQNATKIG